MQYKHLPKVYIAILNWNGGLSIERCVSSIMDSRKIEFDLNIIDNNSSDFSIHHLEEMFGEKLQIIRLPFNAGYAGGMNVALNKFIDSENDLILLVTQDVVFTENTIYELISAIEDDLSIGIVGPIVKLLQRGEVGEIVFTAGGVNMPSKLLTYHLPHPIDSQKPYIVDYVDGCCMLIRREVVDQLESFDDRYFMYFEDNDFCHRAAKLGWGVAIAPTATVFQEKPEVWGIHHYYYVTRNQYLFWHGHYGVGSNTLAHKLFLRYVLLSFKKIIRTLQFGLLTRRALLEARSIYNIWWSFIHGARDHKQGRYGKNQSVSA